VYTESFINVNGIQLHYVIKGKGELLLLLHGFPEFWYSWRNQIPALAAHFTVVATDLRGYNKSDAPSKIEDYKIDVLANDIKELIINLGYKKANIVAHDWGAGIAWYLAAYHPEVVDKLVILNMPVTHELKKNLLRNPKQRKRSWYMYFFQIPFLPEMLFMLNPKKFFKQAFQAVCVNKDAFSDNDIKEYVKAFNNYSRIKAAINYYRAFFRYFLYKNESNVPLIKSSVLLIYGENDWAFEKELIMNTHLYCEKNADIKFIPKCSHWVQHEQPELVNQYILEFLK
jgi:pimeloyl-ACP methyl ester carboxylesterase